MKKNKHSSQFALALIGLLIGVFLAFILFPQSKVLKPGAINSSHITKSPASTIHNNAIKKEGNVSSTETEIEQTDPMEEIENVYGDRAFLNTLPPPSYHPRAESEWQGMLVNTSLQSICEGDSSCGLAMACNNNLCGACSVDADCASNEVCVLDHCVIKSNTSCHTSTDCRQDEYCVLSGYSADPRGNQSMLAYCQSEESGTEPSQEQFTDITDNSVIPSVSERPVSIDRLRQALLDHANNSEHNEELIVNQVDTEPFNQETAEFEFNQHEAFDKTDPENE